MCLSLVYRRSICISTGLVPIASVNKLSFYIFFGKELSTKYLILAG